MGPFVRVNKERCLHDRPILLWFHVNTPLTPLLATVSASLARLPFAWLGAG